MLPDEPSREERLEETDNDSGTTPFQAADDVQDEGIDNTHPITDTEIQPGEIYSEGEAQATDAAEPNKDSSVLGYDPENDQRKTDKDT